MFGAFELRLVAITLVVISQATLSLLTVANIIALGLKGPEVTVPVFIVATNGLMSLAILVIVILDYARRSPLGVLSEIILCAAASSVDLIAAVAMLLMKSGDAICRARFGSEFWNACGAHFAIMILLWTAAALLFIYAGTLLYATKQYQRLHPSENESIWKRTVKGIRWSRETYTIDSPPGRRLRKKGPLDIESLRRVIPDKDSVTSSRDFLASPLPATPSCSAMRPPGLNSPTIGFAERMGYLRRDAMGEYVPSTPTLHRGPQPGYYHPSTRQDARQEVVLGIQNPTGYRRPSFPDLPNPFPPQPAPASPMRFTQPAGNLVSRSRTPSHSSGSTGNSSPGFAGLGAGVGSQKDGPRISIPMPLVPLHIHGSSPTSAKSIQHPRVSMLVTGGQQRPFRVSVPVAPAGGPSPALPRMSLQSSRYPAMPVNQVRQPGARPQYSTAHQPARSHHSLIPPAPTVPAPVVASNPPIYQTRPRADSASSDLSELPSPFLPVPPPPAMSPSTKQRVSNQAYPLPLPPLSTYPIKSVAMSAGTATRPDEAWATAGAIPRGGLNGQPAKDRPTSTVSTVSIYSTSSASHGPPPSQERLANPSLFSVNASTESDTTKGGTAQRSDSTSSRRSLKSKKAPTLARAPSHHGVASQNLWGGTGNGQMRRSLASQFQQPQARAIL